MICTVLCRIMHTFCRLCSDRTSHYHCYSGHTEVVKVLLETVRFEFSVDCFGFGNASALMSGKFCHEEQLQREVGGWGRDPFSRNLMSPTPRRKWYLTTGRRFH